MPRATVLIPTHEHGQLLGFAVRSALDQTVSDIEVFVVLDGPDPETLHAAEEAAAADDRVRLFRFDKGERHGEAHRHVALQEARGRIVCYLSDDDLWFPDHVEYLDELLADADFAHTLPVVALPDRGPHVRWVGNLGDRWYLDRLRSGINFIPLPTAGHTLEAYRSLPVGWAPAPVPRPTDLHMWLKFLDAPGLRFVSGGRPTVLHFPSSKRRGVGFSERRTELESWYESLQTPGAWEELRRSVLEGLAARAATAFKEGFQAAERSVEERDRQAEDRRAALEAMVSDLEAQHAAAEARWQDADRRVALLTDRLAAIEGSIAYRASRRLARMPVIGRVARWVGVALARRGGR